MRIFNKILMFTLVIVVVFSSITRPAFAKYTGSYSGLASHTWFTGKIITDTFRITNSDFTNKETVTSPNLHGMSDVTIDLNNKNATYTIPNNADYKTYSLDTLGNKVFVVQNSSDYDLVACFDIVVCMGWSGSGDPKLDCTITAAGVGEEADVSFTVRASKSGSAPTGAPLKSHKENANDSGDDPIINVQYSGILGNYLSPYRAYSTHIDPTEYDGDDASFPLSTENLEAFVIIPSGATKTFTLSITPSDADIGDWDRNAYASMTMTVKKYERSTT